VSSITKIRRLNGKSIEAILIGAGVGAALGSMALAAQDRYTLRIPDGLAWSEFRGYETWQDVAVSQTETSLKVIAANEVMIKAFRDGLPENGELFPDGSMITKIEWSFKKNEASPYFVNIPDTLKTVAFIVKDTKRFPRGNPIVRDSHRIEGFCAAQPAQKAGNFVCPARAASCNAPPVHTLGSTARMPGAGAAWWKSLRKRTESLRRRRLQGRADFVLYPET
jgi:hypothetical protein